MVKKHYRFYMDETATGEFTRRGEDKRIDGMNCFGFGGVLIKEDDIELVRNNYKIFCKKWKITYPLHSTDIRGKRYNFEWMKYEPFMALKFTDRLTSFICSQKFLAFAIMIDKKGHAKQFEGTYRNSFEDISKMSFTLLIERVVNYVASKNGTVSFYIENAGKKQNTTLEQYLNGFKKEGNVYAPKVGLSHHHERFILKINETLVGNLVNVKKENPFVQLADLCIFPIAKSGYNKEYIPFKMLMKKKRIIDSILEYYDKSSMGLSYYYFPP